MLSAVISVSTSTLLLLLWGSDLSRSAMHPHSRSLPLSAESVFDGIHEIHVWVRDTIIHHIDRLLLECAHVDDSVVARSIIIAA